MLSIIITHHQTPVLLKLCLKSIQDTIGNIEYEIIVADSEAKQEYQDLIKEKFSGIKFISFIKNVGYAKAVNAGIKASLGEYILILNADIIVHKESILKMLEFIKSNLQVGIVGPQLLTFANTVQNSCFNFPSIKSILARRTFLGKLNWGKKQLDRFLVNNKDTSFKSVDWLQGSAMMVQKKAIEKVGLFDERFVLYLEDADWCRRFWQNGYQVVYLPTAQVFHYYGRASKKWGGLLDIISNKYTRMHLISAVKYFWKWRKNQKHQKSAFSTL
ncbi:MAG: glycosyltransferase family 2 protein [bacterium]